MLPCRSITSCMTASSARMIHADDLAPGTCHQHPFQFCLHPTHFRRDVLAQSVVVAQLLRVDALHHLLRLLHQTVEILAGADVEVLEALEKLIEVDHGGIPEDAPLAVRVV